MLSRCSRRCDAPCPCNYPCMVLLWPSRCSVADFAPLFSRIVCPALGVGVAMHVLSHPLLRRSDSLGCSLAVSLPLLRLCAALAVAMYLALPAVAACLCPVVRSCYTLLSGFKHGHRRDVSGPLLNSAGSALLHFFQFQLVD